MSIASRSVLVASLVLVVACVVVGVAADKHEPGELFPPLAPYDAGQLKVSDLHTIAYYVLGNPKGRPVFVLHGGPGVGCYPRLTQYFDPEKYRIVLHDQRGSGKSRPAGEIRENTTADLVEDIERLRQHLKIEGRILVFGGSWGSTLALAHAEKYPQNVSGLILRGVFTGTAEEVGNAWAGPVPQQFFPEAVAELEASLPASAPRSDLKALLKLYRGEDTPEMRQACRAWTRYYLKTSRLHAPESLLRDAAASDEDPRQVEQIDCHYATNQFFLEEGQLLRDADKLRDIPATIINGRYDVICPPITAWRLHQKLPKSKLVIVEEAGHSEGEPGVTQALLKAVAEFEAAQ